MSKANGTPALGTMPTVLLVGRTKIGKTSAILRAFGARCFYICTERGALIPAFNPLINPSRWRPERGRHYIECLSLDDPCGEVEHAIDAVLPRLGTEFGAVAIDTLSSLADRDMPYIQRALATRKFNDGYVRLYERLKHIVWRLMQQSVLIVATAHEQDPSTFEGRFKPGGAKLPGQLVRDTPSLFDLVLRCSVGLDGAGLTTRVFRCDPLDSQYITGDRFGLVADCEPMDLLGILRRCALAASGHWDAAAKLVPKVVTAPDDAV